ncbi:MAG: phospho-N-acetylmuramoyl-pentapeptide-transferase [Alphaproteobacteria bacterium]
MIYVFSLLWGDHLLGAHLFRYLTFRTIAALMTAFFLSFFLGDPFITWLKSQQKGGQPIRDDGPASHLLTKQGTPTMGGGLILLALTFSTLLWCDLRNLYIWIVLAVTLGFGAIGAVDDFLKLSKANTQGLSGRWKLILQVGIGIAASLGIMALSPPALSTHLAFPFFKSFFLNLAWFFPFFATFVMVGTSNSVNLTDGLDGLAIGPVMLAAGVFCVIAYAVGHGVFSNYLQLPFVPGAGELSVLCGALIGAGLGFLWYNAPPAMVFMGDTGSLSVGGCLGAISVITKHEIVLAIVGGLFVVEALSVMLQVLFYKKTRRRIFLMAPIHHHFEKKGWSEPTIVFRFWIIAILLALIGLSTLKIR